MADLDIFARSCVILAASGYIFYYFLTGYERVNEREIGFTVKTAAIEKDLYHPYYTICPHFKSSREAYNLDRGWLNSTLEDSLNNGYEIDAFIRMANPTLWTKSYKVNRLGRRKKAAYLEPCYTYNHTTFVTLGSRTAIAYLDINMRDVFDLDITIHPRDGYGFSHMNYDGKPYFRLIDQEDRFSETNEYREMHISLEAKVIERWPNDLCVEDESYVDNFCVEKFLENQMGCRLPWLKNLARESDGRPLCSGVETLKHIIDFLPDHRILTPENQREFLRRTGCKVPCSERVYKPRVLKNDKHESCKEKEPYAFVVMEISNRDVRVEQEVLLYETVTLFSQIAGFFGLMLGYSILTFYEIVAQQINRIRSVVKLQL